MKIYPLGYRTAIKAMAVISVVLAVCALLVYAGIQSEAPTVAAVLYGVVAFAFLIMVVRILRLPEQSWVAIDQETISWRTPPKARHPDGCRAAERGCRGGGGGPGGPAAQPDHPAGCMRYG